MALPEFLACPRCGGRVDEDADGNELGYVPGQQKTVDAPPQRRHTVTFLYCAKCGTMLGVLPVPE